MSCDNCEALQCDIDYLEGRIDSLTNENYRLEGEAETLATKAAELEDALAALQDELAEKEDRTQEVRHLISLYSLRKSQQGLDPYLRVEFAEEVIAQLIGFLGVDVCLSLV